MLRTTSGKRDDEWRFRSHQSCTAQTHCAETAVQLCAPSKTFRHLMGAPETGHPFIFVKDGDRLG